MPGPYRLIVFDWDGTLLDSIASIVRCTEATMRELGLGPVDEGTIRAAIGMGIRESVEAFCPGCDEETFGRIVTVYRELWFSSYGHQSSLFTDAEATLRRLALQEHLLAVATAKSRRGLETDFERTGVRDLFSGSRTADETAAKPNPHMVLELLDELGVRTSDALVVGDSVHDLDMATNAGVDAVAVGSGATAIATLERHAPRACLAGVGELPDWLDSRT